MSEAQHTMPTRAKTTRTRHVSRRIKEAKIKPTARKTKGVALMKMPYADAIEVATEDVLGWFEACETERDCRNLANGMKGIIESVAQCRAKWLSGPDAPIPDPMRARPSKDGVGLDKTPFTVHKEPRHPLYTFDCCWFCGVDILRAESKRAVGKMTIPYRDCVRDVETNLDATVYELNEKTPEGARLRGHMAIADYHGGWVVWAGDDIDYEKE